MHDRRIASWWAAGAVVLLGACAAADEAADAPAVEAAPPAAPAAVVSASMPGTEDAGALWAHLKDEGYTSWNLWPGKGEHYPGGAPHGATLTTYLNGTAARALDQGAASMPAGSIIVKENYMPDGALAAITTMYKVTGFNPEAGDWHWVKYLPDGSVDGGGTMHGIIPGCIGCHTGKADNDYIFTSNLGSM